MEMPTPNFTIKKAAIIGATILGVAVLWPFYSVPTGSRGVVTQFGKIVGIEGEGLAVLPPWQKLNNFSIRAEEANIEDVEGSTSDKNLMHFCNYTNSRVYCASTIGKQPMFW